MAEAAINLTLADSGATTQLTDGQLIKVFEDTLGATVVYDNDGARPRQIVVTETPAAIAILSGLIIDLTLASDGTTVFINNDRIYSVNDDTLGSVVEYNNEGATREQLVFTQTPAQVKTKRDAL